MIGDSRRSWRRTNRDPEDEPGDDHEDRRRREPVLRELLEPVDDAEDGEQRHRDADEVQRARVRVPVLGQRARSQDEQEAHDRYADEEHRPPPEELEEHAAEDRTDGTTGRVGGDPDADGGRALLLGSRNIVKMSDRVDGAIVAPAMPMTARLAMSISGARRERGEQRGQPRSPPPRTGGACAGRCDRRACPS